MEEEFRSPVLPQALQLPKFLFSPSQPLRPEASRTQTRGATNSRSCAE